MKYDVQFIPLDKIYLDAEFNCRGAIMPLDVIDLVKDIDNNDLQFPIAIQHAKDVENGLPEGFNYRIIAGHRRYVAFKVLKRDTIPAMIKTGLNELQARLINFNENLRRKNLNILQEARAVFQLKALGMTQEAIAAELGNSRSWVQSRFHLLDLPVEIQEEAAAGMINQYQIKQIYGMGSKEAQYEAVRKIKNARLNGERGIDLGKKAKDDPFKKKRQSKTAVQEIIDHLGASIGFGLHTRVLAWANGSINSAELFFDIKRFANENEIDYKVPLTGFNEINETNNIK